MAPVRRSGVVSFAVIDCSVGLGLPGAALKQRRCLCGPMWVAYALPVAARYGTASGGAALIRGRRRSEALKGL